MYVGNLEISVMIQNFWSFPADEWKKKKNIDSQSVSKSMSIQSGRWHNNIACFNIMCIGVNAIINTFICTSFCIGFLYEVFWCSKYYKRLKLTSFRFGGYGVICLYLHLFHSFSSIPKPYVWPWNVCIIGMHEFQGETNSGLFKILDPYAWALSPSSKDRAKSVLSVMRIKYK